MINSINENENKVNEPHSEKIINKPSKIKKSLKKKKITINETNDEPNSVNIPIPININLDSKGNSNPVNKLIDISKKMPIKVNDSSSSSKLSNMNNDNSKNEINNNDFINDDNKLSDEFMNQDSKNEINDMIEKNIDQCIEASVTDNMNIVDDALPPTTNEIFNKFNLKEEELEKYKGLVNAYLNTIIF